MNLRKFLALVLSLAMTISVVSGLSIASFAADNPQPEVNAKYVTPTGAGSKDGSDWNNAFEGNKENGISDAWEKTPANGTLYVGSGEYTFPVTLASGGESKDAMKKFIGVDSEGKKATFVGDWSLPDQKKRLGITLAKGACNVYFGNFNMRNFWVALQTKGDHRNLKFEGLQFNDCRDCIILHGGASKDNLTSYNDGIEMVDCSFYDYAIKCVRTTYGNKNVQFTRLYSDAGGKDKWYEGNFPIAYQLAPDKNQPDEVWEENITYTDCVSINNYHEAEPEAYWNADSFCSERQARNVTYIRCYATGNTDGGWDDKGYNPTLIDCVSVGNKRNYRFWCLGGVNMINCLGAYSNSYGGLGSSNGVMACGGSMDPSSVGRVIATRCTFYNNQTSQINLEGGYIELHDCIVGTDDPNGLITDYNTTKYNEIHMDDSNLVYIKGVQGEDPEFVNPYNTNYKGKDSSFNSKFGDKKGFYLKDAPAPETIAPAFEFKSWYWTDLIDYSWAKYEIERMTCRGYMDGRSDTVYEPGAPITRAEFLAGIANSLELKGSAADFADVSKDHKYYAQISAAKAAGIAVGDNNNFRPDESITREDLMVIAARAIRFAEKFAGTSADLSLIDKFNDKSEISDYAKNDVAFLLATEVIKGYDDNTIKPKSTTTRAEGTVIVSRIYYGK